MKKLNTMIQDRNTLILLEDGKKGDSIDLLELNNIDYANIEKTIEEGKDKVYQKKIIDLEQKFQLSRKQQTLEEEAVYQKKINELRSQIDLLSKEKENDLKLQKLSISSKYEEEIKSLNNLLKQNVLIGNNEIQKVTTAKDLEIEKIKGEYNILKQTFETDLENERLKASETTKKELDQLRQTITYLKQEKELAEKDSEIKLFNKINELKQSFQEKIEQLNQTVKDREEAFNTLQRQKASLNIKQIGEGLESWCDNEVLSYMQNGLSNCTWKKDNEVVKDDGESKGTKADYIFKVFASEEHKEDEMLASVCLDMKDENPNSLIKKKNEDHYRKLDLDRNKKGCKYAVLVSELEMDRPNDLPIMKVNAYNDMYVVRPAYLMAFLNMIVALSNRFSQLILKDKDDKLLLANSIELMKLFDSLKETYLDKPLDMLKNEINNIKNQAFSIKKFSDNIDLSCDKIIKSYLENIQSKLENFNIKINKGYKKLNADK